MAPSLTRIEHPLLQASSILIGISLPLMLSGRAVLQSALGLALFFSLIAVFRDASLRTSIFKKIRTALMSSVGKAAIAAFVVGVPSVYMSIDSLVSAKAWARTAFFYGCGLLFWAIFSTDKRLPALALKSLMVTLFVTLFIVLSALLGWTTLPFALLKGTLKLQGQPDLLIKPYTTITICLIPVALYFSLIYNQGWRLIGCISFALILAITFFGQSRASLAGIAAIFITGIFCWAFVRAHRTQWIIGILGVLILALTLWLKYRWGWLDDVYHTKRAISWLPGWVIDLHRQQIWTFAFNSFLERPWFGWGANLLNEIPGASEKIPNINSEYIPSHPHNWILELIGETGIFTAICVFFALALFAYRLFSEFIQTRKLQTLTTLTCFACFWTISLFNVSIWSVWWQLTFLMIILIMSSHSESQKN